MTNIPEINKHIYINHQCCLNGYIISLTHILTHSLTQLLTHSLNQLLISYESELANSHLLI